MYWCSLLQLCSSCIVWLRWLEVDFPRDLSPFYRPRETRWTILEFLRHSKREQRMRQMTNSRDRFREWCALLSLHRKSTGEDVTVARLLEGKQQVVTEEQAMTNDKDAVTVGHCDMESMVFILRNTSLSSASICDWVSFIVGGSIHQTMVRKARRSELAAVA